MEIKRKINWCFIFSIIVMCANLLTLVMDIWQDLETFWIVIDVVYIVCALICIVGFGVFKSKNKEYVVKHRKAFIWLVVFACLSSLLLGFLALFALFEINTYKVICKQRQNDDEVQVEGGAVPTAEEITAKIEVLKGKRNRGEITEEEYEKLKQEILNELTREN